MIEKCPDSVGIRKIHSQLHAGVRTFAAPVRQVERVPHCGVVDSLAINLQDLEMNLMNVKDVVLGRAVLDGPVFDIALMHNDIRGRAHFIRFGRLSLHGDEVEYKVVRILLIR